MNPKRSDKIAFISNTSWSIFNFRIEIIRYLQSQGHDIYVIAPRDDYSAKLTSEGIHFIPIELDNYSLNPFKDIKYSWHLWRLYRKYNFDRLYHYTIKPNIYGSISAYIAHSNSSILVVSGLGKMFLFQSFLANFFSKILYKVACRSSDQVWFLNVSDRDRFVSEGICPIKKTCILPSEGINTDKFRPAAKKEKSITRFLFAGRLIKSKGIYIYIKAATILRKRYPNTKFEVLGFIDEENPESIKHEEILYWYNAGVIKYLGSTEDVRPYIQRSDCLIFPSYYQEGLSRILLEAASMCTPIITTDQVGCKEVVEDGITGILCEPQNVDQIISAAEQFIVMGYEARQSMGAKARQLVKNNYDIELVKSFYSDIRTKSKYRDVTSIEN